MLLSRFCSDQIMYENFAFRSHTIVEANVIQNGYRKRNQRAIFQLKDDWRKKVWSNNPGSILIYMDQSHGLKQPWEAFLPVSAHELPMTRNTWIFRVYFKSCSLRTSKKKARMPESPNGIRHFAAICQLKSLRNDSKHEGCWGGNFEIDSATLFQIWDRKLRRSNKQSFRKRT